jgi:hypothetical protein
MPNRHLWTKNVPRVEYDHRARNTRLRLEHIERLLVKRDAAGGFRCFRQLLLLLGDITGSGRGRGWRTGSPNDQWPCHIGTPRRPPYSSDSLRLSAAEHWSITLCRGLPCKACKGVVGA